VTAANLVKAVDIGMAVVAAIDIVAGSHGAAEVVAAVAEQTVKSEVKDVATAKTVTRYMGKGEASAARSTGEIPNVGVDGAPRPTHVTTDTPISSAAEAQKTYELPSVPTHSATVPSSRVSDLGPAPSGPRTSGGGSQNVTNSPIPVNPNEIQPLNP
jgi:hypothetical protein